MLKVNGVDVSHCRGFAYDGCHKIYLTESDSQIEEACSFKYDIMPMWKLKTTFITSCPLRFISWWNLSKPSVVPQCSESVEFKDDNCNITYHFK